MISDHLIKVTVEIIMELASGGRDNYGTSKW